MNRRPASQNVARRAAAFAADLAANVDAWYSDRIAFEAFRATNRTIWDRVEACPAAVKEEVLRLIRERLPAAA